MQCALQRVRLLEVSRNALLEVRRLDEQNHGLQAQLSQANQDLLALSTEQASLLHDNLVLLDALKENNMYRDALLHCRERMVSLVEQASVEKEQFVAQHNKTATLCQRKLHDYRLVQQHLKELLVKQRKELTSQRDRALQDLNVMTRDYHQIQEENEQIKEIVVDFARQLHTNKKETEETVMKLTYERDKAFRKLKALNSKYIEILRQVRQHHEAEHMKQALIQVTSLRPHYTESLLQTENDEQVQGEKTKTKTLQDTDKYLTKDKKLDGKCHELLYQKEIVHKQIPILLYNELNGENLMPKQEYTAKSLEQNAIGLLENTCPKQWREDPLIEETQGTSCPAKLREDPLMEEEELTSCPTQWREGLLRQGEGTSHPKQWQEDPLIGEEDEEVSQELGEGTSHPKQWQEDPLIKQEEEKVSRELGEGTSHPKQWQEDPLIGEEDEEVSRELALTDEMNRICMKHEEMYLSVDEVHGLKGLESNEDNLIPKQPQVVAAEYIIQNNAVWKEQPLIHDENKETHCQESSPNQRLADLLTGEKYQAYWKLVVYEVKDEKETHNVREIEVWVPQGTELVLERENDAEVEEEIATKTAHSIDIYLRKTKELEEKYDEVQGYTAKSLEHNAIGLLEEVCPKQWREDPLIEEEEGTSSPTQWREDPLIEEEEGDFPPYRVAGGPNDRRGRGSSSPTQWQEETYDRKGGGSPCPTQWREDPLIEEEEGTS
ncbi:golgin subfamily A member 6-like protein 26 [Scylla paramamosain]|uniref:golgin subfamily A member 6-like protein 26 n=1 Tax=Scylla paramamosain TaxID=85552 RepID=UPI003083786F